MSRLEAKAAWCLLSIVIAGPALAQAPGAPGAPTTLESSAQVPSEQDACLDHSVRELGMSAKRQGSERVWKIGPQFLHPSITPKGTVTVRFDKAAATTTARVTVTWPGAPQPKDVQAELESRVHAMVEKMAQLCGAAAAKVTCQLTPSGGKPQSCNR